MSKVKALKDFIHSGVILFKEGDEISVKEYAERYFFIPKGSKSILLPEGIVTEDLEDGIAQTCSDCGEQIESEKYSPFCKLCSEKESNKEFKDEVIEK